VLRGELLESAMTPGLNVLKTFDPPLHAVEARTFSGVARRGKLLLLELEAPSQARSSCSRTS
jgi:formamidopyrimidine-DNA glycosylase